MHWLNNIGHADAGQIETRYAEALLDRDEDLVAVHCGIAWGGGVENHARIWKGRGVVYGYDTFEGHPHHLYTGAEASAMEWWYSVGDPSQDMEQLTYEYQTAHFAEQELDNVILVKGEVNGDSWQRIETGVHYVLLDMDAYAPTKTAYLALADKIVAGGYLLMHDVFDPALPNLTVLAFTEILPTLGWDVVEMATPAKYLVLQKKGAA